MHSEDKLSETIAFRVTPLIADELKRIAKKERRKLSQIVLDLVGRGLHAYYRDGLLLDPFKPEDHTELE